MNRFNTHNPLFEDKKSVLASFFKSELSALIRSGEQRSVAGDEDYL